MNIKTSKIIKKCQICNSDELKSILFLGYLAPVNTMLNIGLRPEEQTSYPLELLSCQNCSLVQIGLEINADVLFPESYPYLSGTTRILRSNFADLENEASTMLKLNKQDLIIDIGSNDGTLLSNFMNNGYRVLGIEPSQAADIANKYGINTIKTYFNTSTVSDVVKKFGLAKLVTAANVFAHIGNVHSVVEGVKNLLSPDGVFVTESHYLLELVKTLQYDTIYHEHLRYYSLKSLQYLFYKHELEIFHVKQIPTHGGSIRVYAAKKGKYKILNSVKDQLEIENSSNLLSESGYIIFKNKVSMSKLKLYELLSSIKKEGFKIYGIGAPSRASTLINYVGLDDTILDAVMEVSSSHKLDKYIPGTRIPVLDEINLYNDQPEYALILSWHIAEELATNIKKKGFKGKFINPLPFPKIFE